ncbi:PREDICTED: uncharacterized protein LOC109351239 [Lupinus angustifolius]|uniref:uncharacterized protein LOC109351239 n=1 Tax=Lupinus angustifolius TaxID=3871 RepID=UPI00092E50D0|nr:PREDICTED: uncharacterized protein LOC109351239 [Lupinus angustifolius]
MEVARSNKGILLYQRKYALDILEDTGMLGSKPCSTPMEYAKKLASSEIGTPLTDPSPYRRLMGKLLYLTHTWPNLSFYVGHLSQFLSKSTNVHFEGAKRILRYLKVKGYNVLDWARCPDSRKSVSGYCFYLGNSLIYGRARSNKW